jgi:hypothetical protein
VKRGRLFYMRFSEQSLMSRWLSQKNEKAGGAGLRARQATGGQGRPPHQFTAVYELFVTEVSSSKLMEIAPETWRMGKLKNRQSLRVIGLTRVP